MAYKIQYTPQEDHRYPPVKQHPKRGQGSTWVLLLLVIITLWLAVNGIPDFLIPGDPDITRFAAAEMVHLMKEGASAKDAITVFCRQVLDGAGV